jgi:intracellular sulfur oxidation DsrE/DsrF family protein
MTADSIRVYSVQRIRALAGLVLAALVASSLARASSDDEVAALIARGTPPEGIVFEIASWDGDALDWAVPTVRGYAERLRKRFPGLSVAVVTHGNEMFSLRSDARATREPMHADVEKMVLRDRVPVHVCATYAERRGTALDAFPSYVNVAPSGPAQVRAYRDLGYTLVQVTRN